jgi:L-alanine-DL-glutamate epimerase-like enolase superfamily enzyme
VVDAVRIPPSPSWPPSVTPRSRASCNGAGRRETYDAWRWDTSILSADDVRRLPARPAAINVKPARVGGLEALLELYETCADHDIPVYGGGQHELGPGRAQIQLLAALFHADAPNDVAPTGYNDADPSPDLPLSPLTVESRPGFG